MRVLFLGTSHVAMFIDAWAKLPESVLANCSADFIAAPAPWLAQELSMAEVSVDGVWRYKSSGLINYLRKSNQYGDGCVDFGIYDQIVFVDFFFCYDYCHLMSGNGEFGLTLDGVPVSRPAWRVAVGGTMGRPIYTNHPQIGTLNGVDARSFLRTAIASSRSKSGYLVARPMLPSQRLMKRSGRRHSRDELIQYARWFDEIAHESLAEIGISYVPRPPEATSEETGATEDGYSVGWLDQEKTTLDEHLNPEYALLLLKDLALRWVK